jgi:segregation and condensation protein B
MSDNYIKNVVEAAMLAAGRPLQLTELAQLFDENARPDPEGLRAALAALDADYASRGIEVKETASGFRIQVRKEMANEVSRLWPERPPKYSRALLETLALIAYRQPITRAEIEAVRGVAVNPNIIKTVIERNWVRVVGTRDVPGRPELLGTTKDFLDYFGLRTLEDLPPLAELKAMGEINLQLDLAKPGEPGSDGGSSGEGGANSAGGEGGGPSGVPSDSSVAAAGIEAGEPVAAEEAALVDVVADAGEGAPAAEAAAHLDATGHLTAEHGEPASADSDAVAQDAAPSVATDDVAEGAGGETAAIPEDAVAEPTDAPSPEPALVAYEHDPHAATITHVDIESDAGDATVEVQALQNDASIDTGEFEMAELGLAKGEPEIETEFEVEDVSGEVDDVSSAQSDEDESEAADDEEELNAGPQSSTELVAAPRDRDD